MMLKLNSDFKLNEDLFNNSFDGGNNFGKNFNNNVATDSSQSAMDNTSTISTNNINQSSIIDDNSLSVGELKTLLGILSKSKTKEEAMAKIKSIGGDVFELGIGMIPVVGNIIGTGISIGGIFSKLLAPKKDGDATPKSPNEFMQLLQIDKEVSILLDDKIEFAFIKYATDLLNKLPDTEPVPNFFNQLKEFIKDKYSQYYNLIKN